MIWTELERVAAQAPDRIALRTADGDSGYTYRQTIERAREIGRALAANGVRRGDRVALWAPVSPRWALVYLGILSCGAVVVPLDPAATQETQLPLVRDTNCRLMVVATDALAASTCAAGAPFPIASLESADAGRIPPLTDRSTASAADGPPGAVSPEDLATIIFTSGTTGTPRGVVITHRSVDLVVRGMRERLALSPSDNVLAVVPSHHVFAPLGNLLVPLAAGATISYFGAVTGDQLAAAIRGAGVSVFPGVPQVFYRMHRRVFDEIERRPLPARAIARLLLGTSAALRRRFGVHAGRILFRRLHATFGGRLRVLVSGGSYFDPAVITDLESLGFTVLQGYGLTESFGAGTLTPSDRSVPGSVGLPLPGVRVDVAEPDDTGVGEVRIGGDCCMQEYLHDPDATARVLHDGWLYTGDLGRFDAAGHLHITGRRTDVVVLSSGKKIAPEALEPHYERSPAILEACVFGLPDPEGYARGERLHAVVVPDFAYLKSQGVANARDVIRSEMERLARELPAFQRVSSYDVRTAPLPRTATKKIVRWQVKQERIAAAGASRPRTPRPPALDAEDASGVRREVLELIRREARLDHPPDPSMNLEIDLGFDSLQRLELVAGLERTIGVRLGDEEASRCLTVREILDLVSLRARTGLAGDGSREGRRLTWHEILADPEVDRVEEPVLNTGPLAGAAQYVGLKAIRGLAAVLFRLSVRGLDSLPRDGAYLVCPNHQSYLDGLLVASAMPHPVLRRMVSLGWPVVFGRRGVKGLVARMTNCVPIDPDANLRRAMIVSAAALKRGKVVLIFPEGGLTWDGNLQPFKKGPAILAAEFGVPIVPVAVDGSFRVWPKGGRGIRPSKVTLTFGSPIAAIGSAETLTEKLESELRRILTSGHG